jgi:hypothetical protein
MELKADAVYGIRFPELMIDLVPFDVTNQVPGRIHNID